MKDSMRITFDFNNMMSEFVGEEGFDWEEIGTQTPNSKKLLRLWKKREKQGRWRAELPYNQEVVKDILETADEIKEKFDNFVVLGIEVQP